MIITVTIIRTIEKKESLSVSTARVNEHPVYNLFPLYLVHWDDTAAFKCCCFPEGLKYQEIISAEILSESNYGDLL